MAGRKNSKQDVEDRITQIIKQIIKGNTSTRSLTRYITDNYEIGKEQAYKDIRTAREYLKTAYREKSRDDFISEALAKYDALSQINFELRDFREVRQIQEAKNKLLGLDAPTKHEVKAETINPSDIESTALTVQNALEFLKQKRETSK